MANAARLKYVEATSSLPPNWQQFHRVNEHKFKPFCFLAERAQIARKAGSHYSGPMFCAVIHRPTTIPQHSHEDTNTSNVDHVHQGCKKTALCTVNNVVPYFNCPSRVYYFKTSHHGVLGGVWNRQAFKMHPFPGHETTTSPDQ